MTATTPTPATTTTPANGTARRIRHCTALAVLALLAAACSGGTDAPGKDEAAGGAGTKADKALEYRKCLRDQGLDVPEPKPGQDERGITIGGDLGKEAMEKAFKACRGKGGGPGSGGSGELTQADKDKAVKFAGCMRKNGVNMPDPTFDGAAMQKALPMPTAGPEKDTFEKAMKACGGERR
ncbi:hypothetical protein [Streptomyces sp. NPDC058657]|uniref:hypothetical protein n=1 Tax=unclassified Streptomyces TaxID=2593676 RepID=UPI003646FD43